jgi:hypothetical protein
MAHKPQKDCIQQGLQPNICWLFDAACSCIHPDFFGSDCDCQKLVTKPIDKTDSEKELQHDKSRHF